MFTDLPARHRRTHSTESKTHLVSLCQRRSVSVPSVALDNCTSTSLENAVTAPMVVANWISMQYYGSVVDNKRFGSGNKMLHNIVGSSIGDWKAMAVICALDWHYSRYIMVNTGLINHCATKCIS